MNDLPKSNAAPDRELCDRVRIHGDERAFRLLYRRHTPALYAFVSRVLGGWESEAEDVVQETWIRAVRSLDRFRWRSTFRTWLTGIGLNAARDALRRSARRIAVHAEPVRSPAPGERLDLESAVAALPHGYRTVFVLHDVEGFTHDEIAERLEISAGTSKSQLHHARRALQRALEPEEESA